LSENGSGDPLEIKDKKKIPGVLTFFVFPKTEGDTQIQCHLTSTDPFLVLQMEFPGSLEGENLVG
jgi:hypothetical protein